MQELDVESLVKDLSIEELGELIFDQEKEHYEEKPVSIDSFIDDDEFLGSVFKGKFLPTWRTELKRIYPTPFYSPFFEVVCLLPIGSGKTTTALVSLSYELYRLLCLRDPQDFYRLRPSTVKIVFTLFSASKSLADDVNWNVFGGFLKTPWLKLHTGIPDEKGKTEDTVHLNKGIDIELGSASIHAIGKAVFGGMLDEADHQRVKSQQAQTSYNEIIRRMESRFMRRGGVIPGKLWLVSAPKQSSDFLSVRIAESKKAKRTIVLSNIPLWVINPPEEGYSGKTFKVFVGDDNRDPAVLEGQTVPTDLNEACVYDVPEEYRDSFEKDPINAIRDLIGVATVGSMNLIRHPLKITKAAVIPHRFTIETMQLDLYDKKQRILDYCNQDYFKSPAHPAALRFVHVDIALTGDKLGGGCIYATDDTELDRVEEKTFRRNRTYYNEWVLSIKAIPGQEIPLYKVRDFFMDLRDLGYKIELITFDKWGRGDMMQLLKISGFNVGYVSVDGENTDPYRSLKNAIYAERVLLVSHKLMNQELRELRDYGDRIDHLPQFSKDITDGVAGAFSSCEKSVKAIDLTRLHKEQAAQRVDPVKQFLKRNSAQQYYRELATSIFPK